MSFSVSAVSDPMKISEIHEELDEFLIKKCKNPFISSTSIKEEMESNTLNNSFPLILFFKNKSQMVGLAPLVVRRKHGIRFAQMLFGYDYTPDFIFESDWMDVCSPFAINYLLNQLGCNI